MYKMYKSITIVLICFLFALSSCANIPFLKGKSTMDMVKTTLKESKKVEIIYDHSISILKITYDMFQIDPSDENHVKLVNAYNSHDRIKKLYDDFHVVHNILISLVITYEHSETIDVLALLTAKLQNLNVIKSDPNFELAFIVLSDAIETYKQTGKEGLLLFLNDTVHEILKKLVLTSVI